MKVRLLDSQVFKTSFYHELAQSPREWYYFTAELFYVSFNTMKGRARAQQAAPGKGGKVYGGARERFV